MILLDLIVNTPGEDEAFSELSVDDDRIPNWAVGEDSILGHRPMWNDEYPTIWDELGITDNMLLIGSIVAVLLALGLCFYFVRRYRKRHR
jgi:hypothetical protein